METKHSIVERGLLRMKSRMIIFTCVMMCLLGCNSPFKPNTLGINIVTISGVLGDHESGLLLRTDLHTTRYWIINVGGSVTTVHAMDCYGIMKPATWQPCDVGVRVFHTPMVDGGSKYRITYIETEE